MSSINPVLLLSAALAARGEAIGRAFAASLQLGAGQFCTNPGLVLAVDGPGLDAFVAGATAGIEGAAAQTMLTPGIHAAYGTAVETLAAHPGVKTLARGAPATGPHEARAALFETRAADFGADRHLQAEVFGASSLLVRAPDAAGLLQAVSALEGQLTIALHMDAGDGADAARLLPVLEEKAGRILVNGFGTGVEVADAMVHGGPFPATSDGGRTTSVGTLAIRRFLRPVCYQDFPPELLPDALRDGNPAGINRIVDGTPGRH